MNKNKFYAAVIAVTAVICAIKFAPRPQETPIINVPEANRLTFEKCQDDILICIAFVENFVSIPYKDNTGYTIGYGTQYYPDGSSVKKNDRPISKEFAKECVLAHCEKRIWPWIEKYVTRSLSEEEMLGTVLFIYNIGGENFSGHKANGKQSKAPSSFLVSLNRGDLNFATARKMTGFSRVGQQRANGLLKRHWVESSLFLGYLKPQDLLKLEPAKFYNQPLTFYYVQNNPEQDGFWNYNHSRQSVEKFKDININPVHNVRQIL